MFRIDCYEEVDRSATIEEGVATVSGYDCLLCQCVRYFLGKVNSNRTSMSIILSSFLLSWLE